MDAAMAVQKYARKVDIEEITLKKYPDSVNADNKTQQIEEAPMDSRSLFYISDMFTTNASARAISWDSFKKANAWMTDGYHRQLVLLQLVGIKPAIKTRYNWSRAIQVAINTYVPFDQVYPLPTQMAECLFLELDRLFGAILREFRKNAPSNERYRDVSASDEELLEEFRYVLLYQNLTDPVFVEATARDLDDLKDEFLADTQFVKDIGGEGTLLSLFTDYTIVEGMKNHIRIAKINRQSIHDVAELLEIAIIKGLRSGCFIPDPKKGEGDKEGKE